MSIVTRTGDKGQTGLFGGKRVSKSDVRIQSYGTVDELNAVLGLTIAGKHIPAQLGEQITRIQNVLFRMGADLATPRESKATVPRIEAEHVAELDGWIGTMESANEIPPYFVLPGGSPGAALLHLARTICRRAERSVVTLAVKQDIGEQCVIYLNRLSDYLFLAALEANKDAGIENVRVSYE